MFRRFLLVLMMLLALGSLATACGGDDSDDSGDDATSADDDKGDSKSSNKNDVKVPTIKDGVLADGSAHVEVSGDKDLKLDPKGGGFIQGGFALLTFTNSEATVILSFQPDSKDEPGGLSFTTKDVSTAGEWGKDCSVTVDDGAKELKGDFSCKELEAVSPTTTKNFKVKINGSFTLPR